MQSEDHFYRMTKYNPRAADLRHADCVCYLKEPIWPSVP